MGVVSRLLVLIVAFAGLGAAQNPAAEATVPTVQLPPCALACLATALQTAPCSQTDLQCQCTNPKFIDSSVQCVTSTCSVVDALFTQNVTQTECGAPVRDRSIVYNVVSTTLLSLASLMVIVRIVYRKFYTSTDLGLDDWFILLALSGAVPSAILNVAFLSANGLGKDIWTLTPATITDFTKAFYFVAILYFFEVFVLKLSLLFFYLKIFPGPRIRRLLWGTVFVDIAFGIAFITAAIFQCTPISYNWTSWRGEGGGTCININALAWSNGGISIVIDIWMLALPLFQLQKLQLNWKKKVGVALMFFVGTFATVISIIRLSSLIQFRESSNITWDFWSVSIWSTVEITVGVICACMPSIRVILVRFAPRVFTTKGSGSADKSFGSSQPGTPGARPRPGFSRMPPMPAMPDMPAVNVNRNVGKADSIRSSVSSYNNFFENGDMGPGDLDESMGGDQQPLVPLNDLRPVETIQNNVIKVSTRFSVRTKMRSPRHPIFDEYGGKSALGTTDLTRRLA